MLPQLARLHATILVSLLATLPAAATAISLNVTALGAKKGCSTLECWQLDTPVELSDEPGTAGSAVAFLGGAANVTYSVLPAGFNGGLHTAPHNQWVVFMTGLAHITLPCNKAQEAYIIGGEYGLILATDTADVSKKGHLSVYPSVSKTVALQIPTRNGLIPSHKVLHQGPCTREEISNI